MAGWGNDSAGTLNMHAVYNVIWNLDFKIEKNLKIKFLPY